jgi:hypothetical protein
MKEGLKPLLVPQMFETSESCSEGSLLESPVEEVIPDFLAGARQ